jgi:hypothetical protein
LLSLVCRFISHKNKNEKKRDSKRWGLYQLLIPGMTNVSSVFMQGALHLGVPWTDVRLICRGKGVGVLRKASKPAPAFSFGMLSRAPIIENDKSHPRGSRYF